MLASVENAKRLARNLKQSIRGARTIARRGTWTKGVPGELGDVIDSLERALAAVDRCLADLNGPALERADKVLDTSIEE
jgi:hypothetical protein